MRGITHLLRLCISLTLVLTIAFPAPLFAQVPNDSVNHEASVFDDLAPDVRIDELQRALLGQTTGAYLDTFHLLDNELVNVADRIIDISALTVSTFQKGQIQPIANPRTRKFHRSETPFEFDISYQGVRLHHFRLPVYAVGFEGRYLYFITAGSKSQLMFVDLKFFQQNIGRTHLGIFKIPFSDPVNKNSVNYDGELIVNSERVNSRAFGAYSDLQQMGFNATVNLTQIENIENSKYVVDQLSEYFDRALELTGENLSHRLLSAGESQEHVKNFVENFQAQLKEKLADKSTQGQTKAEAIAQVHSELNKNLNLDDIENSIGENFKVQRKLLSRITMLWASLRIPQPLAVESLLQTFGRIVGGFKHRDFKMAGEAALDLIRNQHIRTKMIIASGIVVAAVYPQALAQLSYQGLDITASIFSMMVGKGKDLAMLGFEAAKATTAGFNPYHFKEAYLTAERFPKFMTGLTAILGTLYLTLGIPYLVTNVAVLAKDLVKIDFPRVRERGENLLLSLINAFIERQARDKKEYYDNLAQGEREARGQDHVEFTQQENTEAERYAAMLLHKNSNTTVAAVKDFFSSFFNSINRLSENTYQRLSDWSITSPAVKLVEKYKVGPLSQAFAQFLFSSASLTHAGVAYVKIWQGWFAIRSFIWSPDIAALTLTYPNYFKLTTNGHIANELNGGSRNRVKDLYLRMFDREYLTKLENWENKFLDVEKVIYKHAAENALKATAQFTEDRNELRKIYGSAKPDGATDFEGLSLRSRTFFRSYFYNLVSGATQNYLIEVASRSGMRAEDTPIELKDQLLDRTLAPDEGIAQRAVESQYHDRLYQIAAAQANSIMKPATLALNQRFRLLEKLDPNHNRQVYRMKQVAQQIKNPQAMARAVRSMVASNLVDKPMQLFLTFVCLAGITEGILMPIQDTMFGPNSWFYLSRMVMLNGFVYGVVSGVLADPWMKLQQDLLHEGRFGMVPSGNDANKSYFSWYRKMFNDRENTLFNNQKHQIKIIWANMKAALTTYMLINLVTLGRFDLDSYVAGYLFTYLVPTGGLASKLEQAFELSSYYWLKDIPERFRSHPAVLASFNNVLSIKRIWFNVYYKVYENLIGSYIDNYMNMKTSLYGPRSFVRILFGSTPTEYVNSAAHTTAEKVADSPAISKALGICAKLFTNNYTDWKK